MFQYNYIEHTHWNNTCVSGSNRIREKALYHHKVTLSLVLFVISLNLFDCTLFTSSSRKSAVMCRVYIKQLLVKLYNKRSVMLQFIFL